MAKLDARNRPKSCLTVCRFTASHGVFPMIHEEGETRRNRLKAYPVPTPLMIYGLMEAIFWKPEFKWTVRNVQYLTEPVFDMQESMVSTGIDFVVVAEPIVIKSDGHHPAAYKEQFMRRVKRSTTFSGNPLYMGTPGFSAKVSEVDRGSKLTADADFNWSGAMPVDVMRGSRTQASVPVVQKVEIKNGRCEFKW